MSRLMRFFRYAAEQPTHVIEAVVGIAVMLSGAWFLSPFYKPEISVSAQVTGSADLPRIIGAFQILFALALLFAIVRPDWKRSRTVRSWMTFDIFILYLFYGLSSIFVNGMERVSWIATFAIALISGVAHLRLKWELGRNA